MIDLTAIYIKSVQKNRKLTLDSVDTLNSQIWQNLIKLYDILHCLKVFLYEWLRMKYSRAVGSQFEALGVLGSKSWRKQTLIFFQKKWGSVFYNFLIRALLRPKIAIRICANISRVNIHIRIVLNNAKYLITWIRDLNVSTESWDNFPCFCTLSM